MLACVVIAALAMLVFMAGPLFAADVNLSWLAPTENTDGSPLEDLAGFRMYRSVDSPGSNYEVIAEIDDPLVTTYLDADRGQGLHCYVVTAYDDDGNESAFSNQGCKAIDTLAPGSPMSLEVT
jgi:hypothetical protein